MINYFYKVSMFLLIFFLNEMCGMERGKEGDHPKRRAFNAAAFIAEAQVDAPRAIDGDEQKPVKAGGERRRRVFNAAAFLNVDPAVVVADAARDARKVFNAAAFIAEAQVDAPRAIDRDEPRLVEAGGERRRRAFNAAAFLGVAGQGLLIDAEREEGRIREAEENYTQILEGAIHKVARENAEYGAMLDELKSIGISCMKNRDFDQKAPADWIKTLILTFADLKAEHRVILHREFGVFIGEILRQDVNRGEENVRLFYTKGEIQDIQKLILAVNLYTYLGEEIDHGRIVLPPPPPIVPADVVPQPGRAAIQRGPWRFWNGAKHFAMPAGLRPAEEEYVSFFMERVMPKLTLLRTADSIDDNLVECVIRAASMGLIGLTEEHIYLEAFESKLKEALDAQGWNGDLRAPYSMLIAPNVVSPALQARRRFPLIDDNHCFFRDLGPTHNLITTFITLHTEDEGNAFVREYNALARHERAGKVEELKRRAISTVKDKLIGLPNIIQETFAFLLENKCTDNIWIRFIKGFNTNLCYDGTYDRIAPVGAEILASGDGTDKRPPNKIFAKMLNEIPEKMKATLTEDRITAFVDAVKEASGGDAEHPNAAFLRRETLDRWFGEGGGAKVIRDFIGNGPDGRCRLSDSDMLELIYWAHVITNDYILPPGGAQGAIAKLFMED